MSILLSWPGKKIQGQKMGGRERVVTRTDLRPHGYEEVPWPVVEPVTTYRIANPHSCQHIRRKQLADNCERTPMAVLYPPSPLVGGGERAGHSVQCPRFKKNPAR